MPTDADFLGLTPLDEPGRFRFTVADRLARLDGQLYGGTAIAVSMAAAEAVTGNPVVWTTTQFVATAPGGAEVDVLAEVLAAGRRTQQVRVTGSTADGAVMFASLGATGRVRPDGLSGSFEHPPAVTAPEESAATGGPFASMLRHAGVPAELGRVPDDLGFHRAVEYREPEVLSHPDPGPGRLCMWARRRDGEPVTAAVAAFIADMVPLSVAAGCGVVAGGISLDNTIRVGAFEPCEWVLMDLRPHAASGGYGHGSVLLWDAAGRLLAAASQSATMLRFEVGDVPWPGGRQSAGPSGPTGPGGST